MVGRLHVLLLTRGNAEYLSETVSVGARSDGCYIYFAEFGGQKWRFRILPWRKHRISSEKRAAEWRPAVKAAQRLLRRWSARPRSMCARHGHDGRGAGAPAVKREHAARARRP